jgi:hypothetical protein
MKKKLMHTVLMSAVLVLFTACPYESAVPVDKPAVKVYKSLPGKWIRSEEETNENVTYFQICDSSEFLFTIKKNEYNSSDSTYSVSNYTAYISRVNSIDFLNIQEDGSANYLIYKMVLGEGVLTLFEVTDNIDEQFTTSEELRAFIAKNIDLSFLFNRSEEQYKKVQ